jgi:tRNA pseudouridine55 synthase
LEHPKDGVLNINKPKNLTSFAAVQEVKALLSANKAGHAGTLDPQAEGVLLILLGEATKISAYLTKLQKEYEALMVLGASTSTQDGEGEILKKTEPKVELIDVSDVFYKFLGIQEQVPPMVSAKRHRGRRLYQLFRQGSVVERTPQKVDIKKLELLSCDMPRVRFRAICSSGTYVRTLCHDIGEALGCGAYLSHLVRLRIGNFKLSDAVSWDRKELFHQKVQSVSEALSEFPSIVVSRWMGSGIRMGRQIKGSEVINISLSPSEIANAEKTFRVVDEDGNLVALARLETTSGVKEFRLSRVFNPGI